jgi:hypothetical protein
MRMRLTNLLLVGLGVGALAVGAYILGSKIRDDATDELTTSLPAAAAAAAADSSLRPALFAANAYFVDNSTYAGMTADVLRSKYDAGLAPGLEVSNAGATGFCVEIEIDGRTFSYHDRNGTVSPGNGC